MEEALSTALWREEGYGRSRGWKATAAVLCRRGDYRALSIVSPMLANLSESRNRPGGRSCVRAKHLHIHILSVLPLAHEQQWNFPKMIMMIAVDVNVALLMYLPINSRGRLKWLRQVIKDKDQDIQSQKWTFSVRNIYLSCYDSLQERKRPSSSLLLNFISFHSLLHVANNTVFHCSHTTISLNHHNLPFTFHIIPPLSLSCCFLLCAWPYTAACHLWSAEPITISRGSKAHSW